MEQEAVGKSNLQLLVTLGRPCTASENGEELSCGQMSMVIYWRISTRGKSPTDFFFFYTCHHILFLQSFELFDSRINYIQVVAAESSFEVGPYVKFLSSLRILSLGRSEEICFHPLDRGRKGEVTCLRTHSWLGQRQNRYGLLTLTGLLFLFQMW